MKNRSTVRSLLGLVTTTVMLVSGWMSAEGAVIYSGIQNIPIATDFDGVFLNVQTGAHSTSTITGWNVNFFFGGIGEYNDGSFQPVRVSNDSFAAILNIPNGTIIDGTSMFAAGIGGSGDVGSEHVGSDPGQFVPGETGIIAFKLTGTTPKYGWMRVMFTLDEPGGIIHDWGYDDTGHGIAAGAMSVLAVPEPARAGLMITGLLAMLLRRRRSVGEFGPRNLASEGTTRAYQPGSVRGSSLAPKIVLLAVTIISPVFALDLDSDGLSDVFQRRYSLPTGPDALTRDTDGDGQSDLREFLFGTDPTDATSVPQTKPMFRPAGVFTLKNAVPGARYGLEVSTNLRTWTEAVAPTVATTLPLTIIVTPKPGYAPRKYFRFVAPSVQPDVDGDGLNVLEEALFGSSDNQADADGDGFTDSQEFINGTDPLVPNNAAPTVNFASPSGAQFDLGSLLSLQVTTTDADVGDSVSLALYEGSAQLGTPVSAGRGGTFGFNLSDTTTGPHVYLAKATDSRGKSSWAAIPIFVRQSPTDDETYGPIEGSMTFTIPASSSDLRSNPFLRPPLFAGAVGAVAGDTLSFNEQPGWNHGAFAKGHYVYVRSGSRLGAIIRVTGNDPNTLKLDSSTHGLVAGDLISLVPQWTLDTLLPPDSVRATTNVHVAATDFGLPSYADAYHLANGIGWVKGSATTAEPVLLPPWGTFSIRHASGSASTSLRLQGDIATGTRRITIPGLASANGMIITPIAFQPMSLNEVGLKDSTFVSDASDYVDVAAPGGSTMRWQLVEQKWVPASGTADGSSFVILPGGAITIGRAAAFSSETTWLQPFGK